jgi:hypothetical protein
MKLLSTMLALMLFGSQRGDATSSHQPSAEQLERARLESERHRQAAIQINDLAGHIHSDADALALVDKIAELFADSLPPNWVTLGFRQRIAQVEYQAVSDPLRLIPEQRIADVWNRYVREIGAPHEALVTVTEIHNLRDAHFASSQALWSRELNQTIWTAPNIYAAGPDGKVVEGCRALETLRVLYDLDKMFDNLRAARERVRKGILVSDEIRKTQENPPAKQKTIARLEMRVDTSPLPPAERRYMQEHGPYIMTAVIEKLFDALFPPTT